MTCIIKIDLNRAPVISPDRDEGAEPGINILSENLDFELLSPETNTKTYRDTREDFWCPRYNLE